MDLPKILLTGLFFFVFFWGGFLEFLDSWAWDSKNLEKHKKNKKTILNGLTQDSSHRIVFFCFFCFFFGFPRVFGQLGLGQQKPREKPKNKKNKKTNPEWTYPRFFSQDCFFFVFFWGGFLEFLDSWAWDSKNLEKHKKNKKTILNGLTQDSSHRIVFFFVFFLGGFLEFLDSWAWDNKKPEQKQKTYTKTILNGLAQDSSHRIDFSGLI